MFRKLFVILLALVLGATCLCGCRQTPQIEQTQATTVQTDPSESYGDETYTVTFLDHNGQVVDTQQVAAGGSAVAPDYTPEDAYLFVGWDRDLSCITRDMEVNAIYSLAASQSVMVLEMKALPGETVTVPVVIVKNPGIAGAKITALYDPALILQDACSGEAFSHLDYTGPGQYMNPCSFTWDSESGMATQEGEILRLTFQVPEDAPMGRTYEIKCIYTEGDIFDENLDNVSLGVINGAITVE